MKNFFHKNLIWLLGLTLLGGCVPAQQDGEYIDESGVDELGSVDSGLMFQPGTRFNSPKKTYAKARRENTKVRLLNPQTFAPNLIDFEDVEIFAITDPCFEWLNATPTERAEMPQALLDECEQRFMEYVHAYAEHGDPTPLKGEEDPVDHGDPTPLSTDPDEDPAGHGDPTPLDGGGGASQ